MKIGRTSKGARPASHGLPSEQRGISTVVVAVVLMLAAGLVVLYTNRAAIMEQRLSGNEIRQKQAFAAAAAGIEQALAYMRKGGIDHDKDSTPDTLTSLTLAGSGSLSSYYQVKYCAASSIPACPNAHGTAMPACTAPSDLAAVTTVACGWSDDDSSVQRLVQVMGNTPALAGTVSTPVITKGTTNLLTGGASILNYFNDLTVWSGGTFLGQSNTGKTFIRNEVTNPTASESDDYRNTGNSPACNNPPAGYQCSTQGSTIGHDTVLGDRNLSSLSADGFFKYFFGQSATSYRDEKATYVVDVNNTLSSSNSTSISSIAGLQDQVIWVEGNASLPGDIGTQDHPVILVVNGDLNLSSNSVVNGFVFVTGQVTGNGSPTIYGALVSGGDANATGNLKVIYDPKTLRGGYNLGKASKTPGGWRDW